MRMKNRFQSVSLSQLKSACEGMPGMGFTVHNEADEMTIHVMGVVGDDFDGLDSATLVPRIRAAKGVPIIMILDTPGGNVFDAVAIYSTLVEHDAHVRADIVGQAASAGTILTASADNIRIAPAGEYQLHSAWSGMMLMGNARELEEQVKGVSVLIERLDKVDAELDQVIALRSGLTLEEVHDFTVGPEGADGTTFTGVEAVEHGFADELLPRKVKPEDPAKAARLDFSVALRERQLAMARMRCT